MAEEQAIAIPALQIFDHVTASQPNLEYHHITKENLHSTKTRSNSLLTVAEAHLEGNRKYSAVNDRIHSTVNLGYSDQDHAHKSIAIMDAIAVVR